MNKYLSIFCLLLVSCSQQENKKEVVKNNNGHWAPKSVAYEIFVQSFYDSDGDGIGDIKGMTSKLQHVKDLGADAIWLMPIMESPSYHKYDVVDYKSIHPDYGSVEDFKAFVDEAHSMGIKVIIDFIINHTGSDHPWFQNAMQGPDAKYRDYYVWADKDSIAEEIAKKEISFDSDNITQWHAVDGDTTAEHYYGFFHGGMPDLNFDNPEVRKEVYAIGKFWLEEMDVDGFRMDAAKHIYPDDRAEDSHEFWAEFKTEMEKIKSNVYIVGEVWANTETQAPYVKGFTALFDFDLAFSIIESVNKGKVTKASISGHGWDTDSVGSFITRVIENKKTYNEVNEGYTNATFLTNHDQNRAMSMLDNDVEKAKAAAAILLTLPGTPYIYYGEEIGMKGMKPDPNIREPFIWETPAGEGRASWIEPKFSTDETITSLEEQVKDNNSLYNYYKSLIEIRKSNEALTLGDLQAKQVENESLLVFDRKSDGQNVIVVHNLSDTEQTIDIESSKSLIFGNNEWLEEGKLTLPAYKSAIVNQ
ncbi:DUF3459 domain-containing protein [Fulvivirga sp. RKSG066]|uniref:alpha-amylase family glycosyl hydrolase n=1 Tax=Fulvivirga aurantia TaxID=2529383 RepID=UPI0012BCC937|nr:alpha-amylase family glycosyl hydrolase [Fulvivirga aurantia]MTI21043.1 DUF3459 domain-containing protein [Fulvivirga aurantia]